MTTRFCDLHMHTDFCDGADSAAAMVASAYEKGFAAVGLSSHSFSPFDGGFGMTNAVASAYREEVRRLRREYDGKIKVYLGIEQDVYSEPAVGYDYIIGSAHYLRTQYGDVTVDNTAEAVERDVRELLDGNFMKYVAAYYELAARIPVMSGADIVGHFDLVTKFNEGNRFFDEDCPEYRRLAVEALRAAVSRCPVFEMNSGGVRRKKRTRPYPAPFLLKELREAGGKIIFSSDAHDASSVGFMFDEMAELARSCGFKSAVRLTDTGFVEYGI